VRVSWSIRCWRHWSVLRTQSVVYVDMGPLSISRRRHRNWPGYPVELWWFWNEWSFGIAHSRTRRGIGGPVRFHHVFLSAGPLTIRVRVFW
jgi:hypothetical protein